MNRILKPRLDSGKRSTNLTLPASLIQEARALDINLSAAAADGIVRAVARAKAAQWVDRNRPAMASYDAFVEREGLLLEDLRAF